MEKDSLKMKYPQTSEATIMAEAGLEKQPLGMRIISPRIPLGQSKSMVGLLSDATSMPADMDEAFSRAPFQA